MQELNLLKIAQKYSGKLNETHISGFLQECTDRQMWNLLTWSSVGNDKTKQVLNKFLNKIFTKFIKTNSCIKMALMRTAIF
mgnify:CR=1 FL=1